MALGGPEMEMDADVAVIGSGAGGLAAAVALARAGLRVRVFEQHYLPGGWCHSFALSGYRFSPGVHYLGELGPGGRARRLLEGLGVGGDLVFHELHPDGFEHLRIGRDRFDIPSGRARLAERLAERFPDERVGIECYLETVGRIGDELEGLGEAVLGNGLARAAVHAPTVLRWALATGRQLVDAHVRDPLLRAILSAQAGDYGLPPKRAAAIVHAGVAGHYLEGGYYPRGGGRALPRAFLRALRRAGGDIQVSSEVTRILVERGRALGVRLADGTEIRTRWVVSNADPGVTFGRLIDREHQGWRLRRRLARTRYSLSALSLFLAADLDAGALGLDSGNYWYYAHTDVDAIYELAWSAASVHLPRLPGFFLTVTTLKDPSKRYGGRHTLEIFTLVSHEAFARWAGSRYGARPADYEALKADLRDRMVAAAESIVPGLGESVVLAEVGTPLTNRHYVAATDGCMYGTEKSRWQIGPFGFGIRTPITGLFLCGASTFSHGVIGAASTGLLAARAITGCTSEELLRGGGEIRTVPADVPAERVGVPAARA